LYSKHIYISPLRRVLEATAIINGYLPDSNDFVIKRDLFKNLPLIDHIKSKLEFSKVDENFGKKQLIDLGIPENTKYVCFFARDDKYLNSIQSHRDWSYHNYRDADIEKQIPAMEELTKQGFYAVRVGSVVKKSLKCSNEKIIDYSLSNLRSEFLDLYLLANCEFFVGDTSGIRWIPILFRKPCVVINLVGRGDAVNITRSVDILLFKKIYNKKTNRFLSLIDLQKMDISYSLSSHYSDFNLELIENSPEEILDAILEMGNRISGNCKYTLEEIRLQNKFKSKLLEGYETDYVGRLGRNYLSQNKDWYLDQESNESV
jgi:putative glycosyltransferase (TIGR04372 family)